VTDEPASDGTSGEAPDEATATVAADAGTSARARSTVVVANQDAVVCEVLARIAERGGHEVVRVTDPAQVSAAVLSATADALVLDLGAGNADALRPLRDGGSQRGADVRAIVICTGPANALVAWHGDADEVLTRPFAATALESAIADSLRRPDDDRRARRAQQVAALSD